MKSKGRILGEGAPTLPQFLVDELELVDRRLRWMWMPDHKCWAVVTPCPPRADGRNYWVEILLLDENGPFEPSMNLIRYMRRITWESRHRGTDDQVLAEMDRKEAEMGDKAEKERKSMLYDLYRKMHKFLHTKTFDLGG